MIIVLALQTIYSVWTYEFVNQTVNISYIDESNPGFNVSVYEAVPALKISVHAANFNITNYWNVAFINLKSDVEPYYVGAVSC